MFCAPGRAEQRRLEVAINLGGICGGELARDSFEQIASKPVSHMSATEIDTLPEG